LKHVSILILDDEKRITDEVSEFLTRKKFDVFQANEVEEAFQILKKNQIDILILDLKLKQASGLDVLQKVKSQYPDMEVIMVTGHGDMNTVIESMRLGAIDFLQKPFHTKDIQIAIERTKKFVQVQQELRLAQNKNSLISMELENRIEKELIGESKAIRNILDLAMNSAQYKDVNVFITGESGTGKEIIARIIHFASARKANSFFPVNCTATPENLMESEFFGHVKGSFTSSISDKKGYFELTDGGTLFLDEIADMPITLQAKLLRVIEEKKYKRVGDEKESPVDVRIVAATNHDVQQLIAENKFRLDLFHRLNTIIIDIPPLRERPEDIEPLLKHFVRIFSESIKIPPPIIQPDVIKELKKYDFPGNVRELKNLTERALIICKSNVLHKDCFSLICKKEELPQSKKHKHFNLEENEFALIQAALRETNQNQTLAAKLLGISRHALIRRLQKTREYL
jgi:DNA-binding NtrC family response regulator